MSHSPGRKDKEITSLIILWMTLMVILFPCLNQAAQDWLLGEARHGLLSVHLFN